MHKENVLLLQDYGGHFHLLHVSCYLTYLLLTSRCALVTSDKTKVIPPWEAQIYTVDDTDIQSYLKSTRRTSLTRIL